MKRSAILCIFIFTVTIVSGCDADKNGFNQKYLLLLLKPVFNGIPVWARSVASGSNNSMFEGIYATDDGVYTAGYITGAGTFWFDHQSVTGAYSGNNALLVRYDKGGNALWARSVGAGGNISRFHSVAGADHGIYAAGFIYGSGNYTFGAHSVNGISASHNNAVLVKYDKEGNVLWARTAAAGPDHAESEFKSIAVTEDGLYAAGYINGPGTYMFGVHSVVCPASYTQAVLVRYDRDGNALWARSISGGTGSSSYQSVSAEGDNIYAAGRIMTASTFWFGHQSVVGACNGTNPLLVKYDRYGTVHWARSTAAGTDNSEFLGTRSRGAEVYAVGYITGTGTYTFGAQSVTAAYGAGRNALIVRFDRDGNAIWARSVTRGTNNSYFISVSAGGDGVYASGGIQSSDLFAFGTTSVSATYASGYNLVLVKYEANGDACWAESILSGNSNSNFNSVAAGGDGIYAAGGIGGTDRFIFRNPLGAAPCADGCGGVSVNGAFNGGSSPVLVKYR